MSTNPTTEFLIAAAKQYAGTNTSAKLCIASAEGQLILENDEQGARWWAIRSLEYSVGIFHPVLRDVKKPVRK